MAGVLHVRSRAKDSAVTEAQALSSKQVKVLGAPAESGSQLTTWLKRAACSNLGNLASWLVSVAIIKYRLI